MNKYPRSGPDVDGERKVSGYQRVEGTLSNKGFLKACTTAGVEPTRRQASKYSRKLGLAWRSRNA